MRSDLAQSLSFRSLTTPSQIGACVFAGALALCAAPTKAQCDGTWISGFANPGLGRPTVAPLAFASILWDPDGEEGPIAPRLVIGGAFSSVNGVAATNLAQWDGTTWSPVGGSVNGQVNCLFVVANQSGGNDLIVGGSFSTAGSVSVTGIARWNGTNWTRVGSALPAGMGGASVNGVTQLQDGRLVAVGRWGSAVPNVVALNPSTNAWQGIAPSLPQTPLAVATIANGELYVGGPAMTIGGSNFGGVVRWTGTGWARPGSGVNGLVNVLTPLFNGNLAVGGTFTDFFAGVGTPGRIAIWNPNVGVANPGWSELSGGVNAPVRSIIELSDRSLLVGGDFTIAGTGPGAVFASRLARYNGTAWSGAGNGLENSPAPLAANADTLTQLPDNSVFVGGQFTSADGLAANSIARFSPPVPPEITEQPESATPCADAPATFTVVTSGNVLSYRWEYRTAATFNNWQPVLEGENVFFGTYVFDASGSEAQTLVISNTRGQWATDYQFRVTAFDGCNSVTSFPTVLSPQVCRCNPSDIASDDGAPLQPIGTPSGTNNGVTEGDYNLFFATFFDAGDACDIANDDGTPLPPFGEFTTNNGVTEGDYNLFFAIYFDGCSL
jgi:hypothetical protein